MRLAYVQHAPDGTIFATVEAFLPDPPRQKNDSEARRAQRIDEARAAALAAVSERSPATVLALEADALLPDPLTSLVDAGEVRVLTEDERTGRVSPTPPTVKSA